MFCLLGVEEGRGTVGHIGQLAKLLAEFFVKLKMVGNCFFFLLFSSLSFVSFAKRSTQIIHQVSEMVKTSKDRGLVQPGQA